MKEEIKKYEIKMHKTVLALENEYNGLRAGRANPHLLDRITVEYYGQVTPLQQVANVSVPEPRIIQIQPWDPSLIKAIEKAILMSDIGINPNNDGKLMRLVFPELSEERRKDLSKDVRKKGEESKVAVRNVRRDAIDHFKKAEKAHEITEDDLKTVEGEMQKLTDEFIKIIDQHIEAKIKEIITV